MDALPNIPAITATLLSERDWFLAGMILGAVIGMVWGYRLKRF